MIPAFVETNVFGWLAQVLILGTAGALLPVIFRVRHARSLVVYCHLVLAACLVLPFVQPWHAPVVSRLVTSVDTETSPGVSDNGSVLSVDTDLPIPWARVLVFVLAGGLVLRMAWLGAGLWRLGRYRRASVPLSQTEGTSDWPTGPVVEFLVTKDLDTPATFGLRRPVVLLPESFLTMDPPAQRSVVWHELIHVRRRDWPVTVAEEVSAAVLWFHPGVCWLVGRARLAREEIVDAEVVRRGADRDSYVRALLEMAAGRHRPRLAPVSMFSDGRELKWRVRALLSEVTMSKSRLFASYAAIAVLVGLAGWTGLTAFPLLGAPVVQENAGQGAPVAELEELEATLSAVKQLQTKIEAFTELGQAQAGQDKPVPGGRGLRGGVLGGVVGGVAREEEYGRVVRWATTPQTPVEESEPGVVRLQTVAGTSFGAVGLYLRAGELRYRSNSPESAETVEGEVTVLLTFNSDGEIVDSRVSSGPDPLRRQALQTALQQNYGQQVSRVLQVVVEFVTPPPSPPPGAGGRGARGGARGGATAPQ